MNEENIISPNSYSFSSNLDNIIDLYFYFKEHLSPNFLEYLESSVPLVNFVYNILYNRENLNERKYKYKGDPNFDYFVNEYRDEIVVSYNLINKFLILHNKHIEKSQWKSFCFHYSAL